MHIKSGVVALLVEAELLGLHLKALLRKLRGDICLGRMGYLYLRGPGYLKETECDVCRVNT